MLSDISLDNVRRAAKLVDAALDGLNEATELMDAGEGMAPRPFKSVCRFAEEIDKVLRRMEAEALARWQTSVKKEAES